MLKVKTFLLSNLPMAIIDIKYSFIVHLTLTLAIGKFDDKQELNSLDWLGMELNGLEWRKSVLS
jgi:hypothetical protein